RVDENLGIYDLALGAQLAESSETSPSTSRVAGEQILTEKQRNVNFTLDQLNPWGGAAGFEFNLFRRESNSRDVPLNPLFFSDVDVSYTQPLLRNFGRLVTERGIRVARLNTEISRETFEQQVTSV